MMEKAGKTVKDKQFREDLKHTAYNFTYKEFSLLKIKAKQRKQYLLVLMHTLTVHRS